MNIQKIGTNGELTVVGTRVIDYEFTLIDTGGKADTKTFPSKVPKLVIQLNKFANFGNPGDDLEIQVDSVDKQESDTVQFVNGTEWIASTPARKVAKPSFVSTFWKRHHNKFWGALGIVVLLILFWSLFLVIDPVGRYQKYRQEQQIEAKNTSSHTPLVRDVAEKIKKGEVNSDIKVSGEVQQGVLTPNSSITLTNLSALKGGVNIVSTGHGTTNIIIVVGRDYNAGGGTPTNKAEWPEGYEPNRREILRPNNALKILEKEDQIFTLAPKEDVAFIQPENWNVKTFVDPSFQQSEYLCSVDNDIEEGFGRLRNGRVTRYKNLTKRPMKVGVRCTKIQDNTNSIWEGSKY